MTYLGKMKLTAIAGFLMLCLQVLSAPKTYFMYFLKGDGKRPKEAAELTAMQAAHIQNLKDQFAKGKILLAGPLADPTQLRRGIVVLRVSDDKEVASLFANDPYVGAGIMTVSAHPWAADDKRFNRQLPDPDAIEENRLVVVTPTKAVSARQWRSSAKRIASSIPSVIGGKVDGTAAFAVYLFQGNQQADLEKLFADDPLVKQGAKLEVIPLWTAKESLPKRSG